MTAPSGVFVCSRCAALVPDEYESKHLRWHVAVNGEQAGYVSKDWDTSAPMEAQR